MRNCKKTWKSDRLSVTGDTNFLLQTFIGSERAISIFRASGFNTTPAIDLVYGQPSLPVMSPPGTWSIKPNKMGKLPIWGPSGLGNPFNNYTWTMEIFDQRLFVGTMDFSYLFPFMSQLLLGTSISLPYSIVKEAYGADLFYFPSANSPAFPESISGITNYTNYGLRTMVPGTQSLFVGTANPMNLMTNTSDALPEGGWELIELTKRPPNTPTGNSVRVNLGNGVSVNFCSVAQAGITSGFTVSGLPAMDLIPVPTGWIRPSVLYVIGSSADWRNPACGRNQASVCILDASSQAHIFQLQFNGTSGSFEWADITEHTGDGVVCGAINSSFIGVLSVMRRTEPIPTLSEWGFIFMLCALLLAGWFILHRIAPAASA